jgi:hypothetical protein
MHDLWAVFCRKNKPEGDYGVSAPPGPQKSWTKSLCLCVSDLLLRIENIQHTRTISWGISNKKTEGRPHGVSLP